MKSTAFLKMAALVGVAASLLLQNSVCANESGLRSALAALEDCVNVQVAEEIKSGEASVNGVIGRCSQEAKAVEDLLPSNSAQDLQHLMKHEIEEMLRSGTS